VRLAARLTDWKIEVRSSTKPEESVEGGVAEAGEGVSLGDEEAKKLAEKATTLPKLPGVGPKTLEALVALGFDSLEKIANAAPEELSKAKGVGKKTAEKIINAAKTHGL
jgi:ERCC4-type nuclease